MNDKREEFFNLVKEKLEEVSDLYGQLEPSFSERMFYRVILMDAIKVIESAYDEVYEE